MATPIMVMIIPILFRMFSPINFSKLDFELGCCLGSEGNSTRFVSIIALALSTTSFLGESISFTGLTSSFSIIGCFITSFSGIGFTISSVVFSTEVTFSGVDFNR